MHDKMKRVASQVIFCSPHELIRQGCIERNHLNIITDLYSLNDKAIEPSNTLFYDGILSAEIISIRNEVTTKHLEAIKQSHHYFDLSEVSKKKQISCNELPIIIDFGTTELDTINAMIQENYIELKGLSTLDLIAACVHYPSLMCEKKYGMKVGEKTKILLWEHTQLQTNSWDRTLKIKGV